MVDAFSTLRSELNTCRRCADAGYFAAPPPIVSGPAGARLVIIGQAPGRVEMEETHLPFSGPAGRRLFRWLAEAGWDETEFRSSQYMTAVTKCYPGPNRAGRGDRVPGKQEQALCQPWLERELALVQPQIVVPIGGLAIKRFLGAKVKLAEVVGRVFSRPADELALTAWARCHLPATARLVPLPHPSGASLWLNRPEHQKLVGQALAHLKAINA